MSRYIRFIKLKHLIFPNKGSIYILLLALLVLVLIQSASNRERSASSRVQSPPVPATVQPLPRVAGPLPPAPRPYAASTCHKADSSRDRLCWCIDSVYPGGTEPPAPRAFNHIETHARGASALIPLPRNPQLPLPASAPPARGAVQCSSDGGGGSS
jgi:hypothetical protein